MIIQNPEKEIIHDPSQLGIKRSPKWWDKWFINLAKDVATASKDPSTKVGAIIVDKTQRKMSLGYNGFPKRILDSPTRLNDRDTKYKLILHAEERAIDSAKEDLTGHTIYVWPFMPCSRCMLKIINNDISRVVAPDFFPERWSKDFELSQKLAKEAGIKLYIIPNNDLEEKYGN